MAIWTEEELALLEERYPAPGKLPVELLARHGVRAVYAKAHKLGLLRIQANEWTDDDEALLRRAYVTFAPYPPSLLERHSRHCCHAQAARLGITDVVGRTLSPRTLARFQAELSPTDLAYMAGIIDGEGSIYYTTPGGRPRVEMCAVNTNKEVIDWLHDKVPGSCVYYRKPRQPTHKPSYIWYLRGALGVYDLVGLLLPHLIIKREAAQDAIAFIGNRYRSYLE